jgi:methylmalonyl-CoA/ethylmalonyl-CoA epimerase
MRRPIAGAKFDHVAHAAARIHDLLPLYQGVLGGEFLHGATNEELGYTTLQLGFAGGTKIELMEPTAGSGFLDSFLARNPVGGMHHITYRVPDIDAAVEAARAHGYHVFGVSRALPQWWEAFLHPRSAHGVLLQLAQSPPDWPSVVPGVTIETFIGEPSEEEGSSPCPSRTTSAT